MKILLFVVTINLFRDEKSKLFMISNARTKKVYIIENDASSINSQFKIWLRKNTSVGSWV